MAGSAIRGSRVGAGPMGEAERGEAIARFRVLIGVQTDMKQSHRLQMMEQSPFLLNGIAHDVVFLRDLIRISHLCQSKMSPIRLTLPMLKNVVRRQRLLRFSKMRSRSCAGKTNNYCFNA